MEEYFKNLSGRFINEETVIPPSMKWKTVESEEHKLIYKKSIEDPVGFWTREAMELNWVKPWSKPIDGEPPRVVWFKDGEINAYYNIIGKHRNTYTWSKIALIWEGEEGDAKTITYSELDVLVNKIANGLKAFNIKPGDWILLYTPPLIESVAAMLASIKLGVSFEPVFTGFGFYELAKRIRNRNPGLIFTVDGFYRRGKPIDTLAVTRRAIEYIKYKGSIVVTERTNTANLKENEVSFEDFIENSGKTIEDYIARSNHPLFGLHSGYRDDYKPITHPTGGFLVQVYSTSKWIGLRTRDTYFCTVWPGWITGISYVVFGPLMIGSTVLLYDGGIDYPNWDRWWSLIEDYAVTLFLTTSGALRILSRQGDEYVKSHNVDTLRAILVTAEPLEVDTWWWTYKVVGTGSTRIIDSDPSMNTGRIPIVNLYIQSEIGTFITGNLINYTFPPLKPGSSGPPIPGFHIGLIDNDNRIVENGSGELALLHPWPSMPIEYSYEYVEKWSTGYYKTGDYAYITGDGYTFILGRIDNVFKVSGYRLSPGSIEDVLRKALNIDAVVYACIDETRYESPIVIYHGDVSVDQVKTVIRQYVGAIADPKIVKQVSQQEVLEAKSKKFLKLNKCS